MAVQTPRGPHAAHIRRIATAVSQKVPGRKHDTDKVPRVKRVEACGSLGRNRAGARIRARIKAHPPLCAARSAKARTARRRMLHSWAGNPGEKNIPGMRAASAARRRIRSPPTRAAAAASAAVDQRRWRPVSRMEASFKPAQVISVIELMRRAARI